MIDKQSLSIKIIDFGLALNLKMGVEQNQYIRCGTYGYMAPEIMKNAGKIKVAYDFKADVFSFGVLAYSILMGCNLFLGLSLEETYAKNREFCMNLN